MNKRDEAFEKCEVTPNEGVILFNAAKKEEYVSVYKLFFFKGYDSRQSEIDTLTERLKEAEEVIRFYASQENFCGDNHLDALEKNGTGWQHVGKTAQEYFKKHGVGN